MRLSADSYVERIVRQLELAELALTEAQDLASSHYGLGSSGSSEHEARSLRSEAWSSIAQEHNAIAMTYTKLMEITTKAGTT